MSQLNWVMRKFWSDSIFQILLCSFHSYFTYVCMVLWMNKEWIKKSAWVARHNSYKRLNNRIFSSCALFLFCFVDKKPKTKQWSVFPPKCKLQLKDSRDANALHVKKIMHVQKYEVFVLILKAWPCTEKQCGWTLTV